MNEIVTDEAESDLDRLLSYSNSPLDFVMQAFPWGKKGTVLEHWSGPEPWQREVLESIGRRSLNPDAAIREATVAGNGCGKSALVSWILLWSITTFEDTRGVITANTETQLKTKTWAELGKWYHLFLAKDLFTLAATAIYANDSAHERTWRIDMVPWSENNVVAFQGLHNEGKRLLMIYDEASGIPDGIWEAGDGCMTDKSTQRIWCVFGNPNRPKGRFRDCFPGGRFASSWNSRTVDSRTISFTDKSEFAQWVKDYGEDSDFVRIRIRGVFPRAGSMQFIDSTTVDEAVRREAPAYLYEPLVIGVDVARFGDDASIIFFRKGRDGRSIAPLKYRGMDTMTLAGKVSEVYSQYRADAVFCDGGGVGGGVVDRLRQLQVPVIEVQFGSKPDGVGFATGDQGVQYANKRAEIWGAMREWLKGGTIPDDPELIVQLTTLEYGYNVRNEIQLERKEDLKRRGFGSCDLADGLALTFAQPAIGSMAFAEGRGEIKSDWDPYSNASMWGEQEPSEPEPLPQPTERYYAPGYARLRPEFK
jgi:hypothetical protein